MGTKDDDAVSHILSASTHDNLLIFTSKGKVFKLKVFELPEASRQAKGQAIVNLLAIEPDETIESVIPVSSKLEVIQDKFITLATKNGLVKKTAVSLFQNIRSTGIIAIILDPSDSLVWGDITPGNRDLLMVTYQGKSIRFPETQIKSTARDTKGVMGIRLAKDDYVVTVESIDTQVEKPDDKRKKFFHDLLVITEKGMGKRTPFDEYPLQNRSGQGVKVMNLSPKTGNLAAAFSVTPAIDQIFITTKAGQIVKLPLSGIPQLTRPTQGVILMRFAKAGDTAVAATAIEKDSYETA
jgi:DNA gyrase subunit A